MSRGRLTREGYESDGRFVRLPASIEKRLIRVAISDEREIGISVVGKPGKGFVILRDCKMNLDSGEIEPTVFTLEFPLSILGELTEAINAAVAEWDREPTGRNVINGNKR